MTQFIQHELINRAEKSIKIRETVSQGYQNWLDIIVVEQENARWLKRLIQEDGWPRISQIGTDAAKAAWKIAYHSGDHLLMRHCLNLMEPLIQDGEADQKDYAFLMDRFLINQGKKQLYGTQKKKQDGKVVPWPIQDENEVDQRRKAIGLPLLT